ncbi:hypothetical protein PanWU01x14_202150 [Parasponia andersonii]|uniref:Uncharacterized protein n=1 Tax=Parasponia andersonii TaxID=3476 RepID=A0A2P5BXF3_PARAD|nr:hypothetical protein PanWU01x14_202150 [Parasponia andersonii]
MHCSAKSSREVAAQCHLHSAAAPSLGYCGAAAPHHDTTTPSIRQSWRRYTRKCRHVTEFWDHCQFASSI